MNRRDGIIFVRETDTDLLSTSIIITCGSIKTESARTSSSYWTKLCTKIIYTLLQAFVLVLQISYQKKSFLTTPNIETDFEVPLNSTKLLKRRELLPIACEL